MRKEDPLMQEFIVEQVSEDDLKGCFVVESACYTSDGATIDKIRKRIELFPEGFLVAKYDKKIIGIINSGSTDKEDITDEEFKDMVGHVKHGKNIVIFSLAVLPEFQKMGVAKRLMLKFIEISKVLKKEQILIICKSELIDYYKRFGFLYSGKSNSTHGGFVWHEMYLPLNNME